MSKKLLVDLIKLRNIENLQYEVIDKKLLEGGGFKSIRELATFRFSCRRCVDAPCIDSCPVEALERDQDHVIHRSLNLCIRCKSCIAACPFGTMALDLFQVKPSGRKIYDISRERDVEKLVRDFPNEMITLTEEEANEKDLFALGDYVLIKDYPWHH